MQWCNHQTHTTIFTACLKYSLFLFITYHRAHSSNVICPSWLCTTTGGSKDGVYY